MGLTKTVTVDITIDRVAVNFATGAVTVEGTSKGSILGRGYAVTLPSSADLNDWVTKVQQQLTKRMDESGALWVA